jgi:hypothetical protein
MFDQKFALLLETPLTIEHPREDALYESMRASPEERVHKAVALPLLSPQPDGTTVIHVAILSISHPRNLDNEILCFYGEMVFPNEQNTVEGQSGYSVIGQISRLIETEKRTTGQIRIAPLYRADK